jgi:sterol desaturase/sphingolipid hydroxylase (fatty acid hydroxylase superfamily)
MWLAATFTVATLATSFASLGQATGAAGVVAGIGTWALAWPSLEYAVHRGLHRDRGSRHMRHHKTPHDNSLFFVPTRWLASRALLYGSLMWFASSTAYALGLTAGFGTFYLAYEAGHAWTHAHGAPSQARPRDRITRWHWRHHEASGVNFGVSTPFWDIVERTASKHTTADLHFTPLAWLLMPLPWVSLALPRQGEGESAKSLDG